MNNNEMILLLTILLILFSIALFIFIGIFVIKEIKRKQKNKKKEADLTQEESVETKERVFKSYTKDSIFNFMEFDKVEDNMIIQKKGKRFLMAIECQGINYDLMSEVEKVAVEEGFLQFLNALRYPVQIYVQSRTINLTGSILNYKKKVEEYKSKLDKMVVEYEKLKDNPTTKSELLLKYNYEITRQKNLYEYGQDVIENTQKMNLNKNILSKKYYIIISYYSEEGVDSGLDKEDIKNIAFSELYTRAQAVIRTLSACEINSKILNSTELINLLYVAYNRDESETFDMEKIIQAGCEDIYSTAPDVFDKKIKALDELIYKEAQERAEDAFGVAKSRKQKLAESKEQSIEDLIGEMAKEILEDSIPYIGDEMAKDSIKILEEKNKRKEGKVVNENKKAKSTRTSKQ